jgi:hypothetical protein
VRCGVEAELVQAAGPAVGLPAAGQLVDGGVTGRGLLHRADQPEHPFGVRGVGGVPDSPLGAGVRGRLFGPGRIGLQHRPGGAPGPLPHRPAGSGCRGRGGVAGQQLGHHRGPQARGAGQAAGLPVQQPGMLTRIDPSANAAASSGMSVTNWAKLIFAEAAT